MLGRKSELELEFGDFSSGLNTTDAHSMIGDNQARKAIDAILNEKSTKKRPGSTGFENLLTGYLRGLHSFLKEDGSEDLLAVSNRKLQLINETDGSQTDLLDLIGDGEAWLDNFKNKAWGCNGGTNFKVESDNTAYQLGITAPSGSTASAASGTGLPDGVYKIYVGYARQVSGDNVLYSAGEQLADVTLGSGNNKIDFFIPDSSDPQVGNKIVWMTDAGGSIYYFFHETDDNTTTNFTVDSTAQRNTAILFSVEAATNYVPDAFDYIIAQDNRIWGAIGNTLFYSLQAGSVYDLERFDTSAIGRYITYPFLITGLFAIGPNLYINTPYGIIVQPNSDPYARWIHLEKRYNFEYPRTMAYWSGGVIGLTNDGVRLFDGSRMLSADISRDVKKEIQKIYGGFSTENRPCGAIHRRSNRTEYHLCYRDTSLGISNNRRLILNADKLQIQGAQSIAPWEQWRTGCNYMAVTNGRVMYSGQSHLTSSVIFTENSTATFDFRVYDESGTYLTTNTAVKFEVDSKLIIPKINSRLQFNEVIALVQLVSEFDIKVIIGEGVNVESNETLGSDISAPRFGIARFGISRFLQEQAYSRRQKLPRNLKGYSVYIHIEQEADDINFELIQVLLTGIITKSRFT